MEFCVSTDFDLFETIKLLTPYILAGIVYAIWHKQKEKEVIANEAKELLNLIDEYKTTYLRVFIELHTYIHNNQFFDRKSLEEDRRDYFKATKEFTSKLNLFLSLIVDAELEETKKDIELNKAKFESMQLLLEDEQSLKDLSTILERLDKSCDSLKAKLIKYAMYKNRIIVPKSA